MDALDRDTQVSAADDVDELAVLVGRRDALMGALADVCSELLQHRAGGGPLAAAARSHAEAISARLAATIERHAALTMRVTAARDAVASDIGRMDLAERAAAVYATAEAARRPTGRSSLPGRARS
jgi:hypothetical protein